jgi:iron complex outermembrane receptor protein
MLNATPTRFDAGGFSFTQNTTNLDLSRKYDNILNGLNVAMGAEYRFENYEILAGEIGSYAQYDISGNPITNPTQTTRKDFFGSTRPGGSQVFPGFSPANEISRDRSSVAGYVDLEAHFSDELLIGLASRYENYSDFGSTINFKLASRYRVNDNVTIRGAANTGFRAPSLHQLYFNSTSTIFDQNGNPVEVGTFSNESRAAKLLGIPSLKEETSKSVSLGITAQAPDLNLTFTIDGYLVDIEDRIVYTGQFAGNNTGSELDNLLRQANASAAAFFANAIDTKSKGLDVVLTHTAKIGTNGKLRSSLAGTFSDTKQDGPIKASRVLIDAGLISTYFPEDSRVYLEEAVPRVKLSLSNTYSVERFNFFLRNVFFGPVTEATPTVGLQQVFTSKIVTDLSVAYSFTDDLMLTVGANNLLDVYPDLAAESITYVDGNGMTQTGNNRSEGRFDCSRRSQQIGIGGRFMFARVTFTLK